MQFLGPHILMSALWENTRLMSPSVILPVVASALEPVKRACDRASMSSISVKHYNEGPILLGVSNT